jgi:ABC-type Fe3+ transport system permease subunit
MWAFRWLRSMATWLLRCVQLVPALALLAAILVDEGPTGEARASSHFFPVVLWLFDDFAWTCARNSIIFAVLASGSSLVLGVGLNCALSRVWSRGRSVVGAAIAAGMACSPAFLALGLTGCFGEPRRLPWPFATNGADSPGASLESWSGISLWVTWIWASAAPAAAFVALSCAPSFRRLDPSWSEAARLAGASSFRIARDLSWPIVRPAAARAAGIVFLVAIVEPGAPLVLGLRRTLAFQIVEAAGGSNPYPRAAVWALIAGLIGLCGWLVFRWTGGSAILAERSGAAVLDAELDRRVRRASPLVSVFSAALLAVWAIVAWLPVAGLLRLAVRGGDSSDPPDATLPSDFLTAIPHVRDPVLLRIMIDSAVFGLEVASGLVLIAGVGGLGSRVRSPRTWWRPFRPIVALPPLVLGVGVLALPWLAALASRFLLDRAQYRAAVLVGDVAATIDTRQHPWILMACGVGLVLLPRIFRDTSGPLAAAPGRRRFDSCKAAAVLSGAPRWRAWALGNPGLLSKMAGRSAVVWAVAVTNVNPALLFSAGGEGKTLGPALLELAGGDARARSQAAALALLAVLVNVAAIAVAYRADVSVGERES